MALCEYRFFSPTLGKQVGAFVILPNVGKPPFATFYLLHGLSDDYTIWQRRTRIEEYVAQLPLAVVMPDGFRTAYTDANAGAQAATYVVRDVIGSVERHFQLRASRNARCIGGLSMGGYGALRLGLGYPDLFCSVNSHSGALLWGSLPPTRTRGGDRASEFELIFGRNPKGSEHDLLMLAERCKREGKLPKLRLDCGVDDFLIDQNRHYHEHLADLQIPHEYDEYPGVHNWDYWDQHVREAIRFHAKNLKLKA